VHGIRERKSPAHTARKVDCWLCTPQVEAFTLEYESVSFKVNLPALHIHQVFDLGYLDLGEVGRQTTGLYLICTVVEDGDPLLLLEIIDHGNSPADLGGSLPDAVNAWHVFAASF
jgi:hypothetical protein